ncbi:hypothetical protein SeMB42_g00671 [Synchytrium endobioticum]|uniref:PAS domain-containing protein n=1 Tax=Synchytrium endobioticum TaxID=286115 RepID=A0A507DRT9_9FUNG|nr:hypothetical protein SeMB42_g00671 [Synchytrium endobioticum]
MAPAHETSMVGVPKANRTYIAQGYKPHLAMYHQHLSHLSHPSSFEWRPRSQQWSTSAARHSQPNQTDQARAPLYSMPNNPIEFLKQPSLPMQNMFFPPSSVSLSGIYSSSGFDLMGVMARLANRPNQVINIGPVDLSCSFVVSDSRKPDNPIIYCSETFERLTGYSSAEILGRNCRFLQSPDSIVPKGSVRKYTDNNVVYQMSQSIAQNKESQYTLINYRKNGEPFINLVSIIPISVDGGTSIAFHVGLQIDLVNQPQAILNKMKDGTYNVNYQIGPHLQSRSNDLEQKASTYAADVQDLLTPSATPIASILPPLPETMSSFVYGVDFIHILSLRGMFLYCSPHSCRQLLEYDAPELMGHSLSEFVHPADLVATLRDLRLAQSGEKINIICRFKRKFTGYVYVELTGHLYQGDTGKRTKCFIMSGREKRVGRLSARDILPSTVSVVEESSGKSLTVGASESWVKISPQGLVLYACHNAQQVYGRSVEGLFAHPIMEFVHPDDRYSLTNKFVAVAIDQRPQDISCRIILPAGMRTDLVQNVIMRIYPGPGVPSMALVLQTKLLGHDGNSLPSPIPTPSSQSHASSQPSPVSTFLDITSGLSMSPLSPRQLSSSTPSTTTSTTTSATLPLNSSILQPLLVFSDIYEGGNLFDIMAPTRATSLHYELNQLKAQNKRLREEIDFMVFKKRAITIAETPVCSICGTKSSPEWRRGLDGIRNVCNACGIRTAKTRQT